MGDAVNHCAVVRVFNSYAIAVVNARALSYGAIHARNELRSIIASCQITILNGSMLNCVKTDN
jgi:hypothetical protein